MLEYLQRIITRLRAAGGWLPPPGPREDPTLGVREPVPRRPPRGSAAVAVAEPGGEQVTDARSSK